MSSYINCNICGKKYSKKNSSRKSIKYNCIGSLDTIFQDIFSCRLKGKYILPSTCKRKTSCIM